MSVKRAIRLNVFNQRPPKRSKWRRRRSAITSPDDVIISGQFSGSVRYYAGD